MMHFDANGMLTDEGTDPLFPDGREFLSDTKWVGEHRQNCYLCARNFKTENEIRFKDFEYVNRDGVKCQGRLYICWLCYDAFLK